VRRGLSFVSRAEAPDDQAKDTAAIRLHERECASATCPECCPSQFLPATNLGAVDNPHAP